MLLSVALGSTVTASTMDKQEFNPINLNLPDCVTELRNGCLVDQHTGKPLMSARMMKMVGTGRLDDIFAVGKS